MGPNFASPESVKNIVCVHQNQYKIEQNTALILPTQNCLKTHETLGISNLANAVTPVTIIQIQKRKLPHHKNELMKAREKNQGPI